MNSLGIDIGGSSVKLACLRDDKLEWTAQSAFYVRPNTQQLLDAIRATTRGRDIRADVVGLCVPGLLDKPRRTITLAVNVPGLMNLRLDGLIGDALPGIRGTRIELINDAIAATSDAAMRLKLTGRILGIGLGTGVGAAVLDDGQPLIVEGESPGHIGQLDVSIHDAPVVGPDGGAGSLEGYIGVPALRARYGEDFAASLSKLTPHDPPIRALVHAIRICHAIYRPNHVILLGGIGIRLNSLVPAVREAVNERLTSVARKDWTLSAGESDFHGAAGAARLATQV